VIDAWGLRNQNARGREAGVPYPGTFLIDRSLRVVERTFEQAYQERSTAAGLLAQIGGAVPPESPKDVSGNQLTATLGTSDAVVPPGGRVTLIIDLKPNPGMHVYAPGQTGYIPVSIALDPSPDFKTHAPKFPPPGTYYFAPLEETVKVYDKPVRVTQDVTLALSQDLRKRATAKETLVITGSLTYQACDDKVCYLRQTIPVSWSVTLTPFVR
jgi:DsbC/DsbD-like thiol-disulfide interchange protein